MHRPGFDPRAASDIRNESWLIRWAPAAVRPYLKLARIDRPIGTWLLLLPCWWALGLASDGYPDPWYVLLFALGALVMRGAGCTVNDLWDRDIDAKVARTAMRPIASGEIDLPKAFLFLAAQLLVGLVILLQFNGAAVLLGVLSLGLVAAYPLMKRFTYWPQAFLGLTFNWGALLAWAAVAGEIDAPAIWLYAGGFFWTLGYDTIYAHQDKEDDVLVGVKSSAIRLGAATKPAITVFYLIAVMCFLVAGGMADAHWPFFFCVLLALPMYLWQVTTLKTNDPDNCLARFKANRDVGLLIAFGAFFG